MFPLRTSFPPFSQPTCQREEDRQRQPECERHVHALYRGVLTAGFYSAYFIYINIYIPKLRCGVCCLRVAHMFRLYYSTMACDTDRGFESELP